MNRWVTACIVFCGLLVIYAYRRFNRRWGDTNGLALGRNTAMWATSKGVDTHNTSMQRLVQLASQGDVGEQLLETLWEKARKNSRTTNIGTVHKDRLMKSQKRLQATYIKLTANIADGFTHLINFLHDCAPGKSFGQNIKDFQYDLQAKKQSRLDRISQNRDERTQTYIQWVGKNAIPEYSGITDVVLTTMTKIAGGYTLQKQPIVQALAMLFSRGINAQVSTTLHHNILFVGPPGTGKSTIADQMFYIGTNLGILSGELVKITGTDLIGPTPDVSAKLVKYYMLKTIDGCLLIDEAYTLCQARTVSAAATAAVDALVYWLTELKGVVTVILAGYDDQINLLMSCNVGLRRRFPHRVFFDVGQQSADFIASALTWEILKDRKVDVRDQSSKNVKEADLQKTIQEELTKADAAVKNTLSELNYGFTELFFLEYLLNVDIDNQNKVSVSDVERILKLALHRVASLKTAA